MSITYEDIQKANDAIKTTPIEGGKEYVEVNQKIKAFRMVYPDGFIKSEQMFDVNGKCEFKAYVGFYRFTDDGKLTQVVIGTGHAKEKENSTIVNSSSYIENCETSAIGRALRMAGFGINEAVVYEGSDNQQNQQPRKATPRQIAFLKKHYVDGNLAKLLETHDIERLEEMSMDKASELIGKLKDRQKGE